VVVRERRKEVRAGQAVVFGSAGVLARLGERKADIAEIAEFTLPGVGLEVEQMDMLVKECAKAGTQVEDPPLPDDYWTTTV
jgi:hypothetical protein